MTILGPVLMACLILAPILLMDSSDEEKKEVWVCDENNLFEPQFEDIDGTDYQFFKNDIIQVKERFNTSDGYALVHIPTFENESIDVLESSVKVYVRKPMSFSNQNQISNNIESVIESIKLKEEGLTRDIIDRTRSNVNLNTIILGESGSEKTGSTEVSMGVSMFGGFLIYIFIFLYGAMVMRGVMEEKTSRIVEIIISSVKPIQLMMGKIIGIALVGFTQFALWVSLTFVISSVATALLVNPADINPVDMANGSEMLIQESDMNQDGLASVFEQLESINITFLLAMFLFYFIGVFDVWFFICCSWFSC